MARKKKEEEVKKLSSDEEKVNLVLNAFTYSRTFFSARHVKFREWLQLYHQLHVTKPPFRSNLFIPMVYPIVSTILPRMVANLPKFRYEPREQSDSKNVKQMAYLVDYELDEMDFFKKLKMWVKDVLIFGTGIAKVYWRKGADYNDPDMDVVDLFEFYPDPKAAEIDGGDFVIHRTVTSKDFLKKQKKADGTPLYENIENIKEGGDITENRLIGVNNRGMTQGEIGGELNLGSPFRQSTTLQVELLEYWGLYEGEEYIITLANRNTLIRFEKSPYLKRPFVKMHIDPINHEFYGKGVIEPIQDLQHELNDTRNQRMDNVNLILNRLFVVLRSANVSENELISRPGAVIHEDIPGGVRILDTPDVTSSAYQEEALIKQDAQNAVGVSDIIQGQLTSANETVPGQVLNKTATGAAIAVQQAGSRFKYYLQNIEDALRAFGLKLYEYNQQFLSEEKAIRIQAPNDYQKLQKAGMIQKIRGFMGMQSPEPEPFQFLRVSPDTLKNLKLDVKVEAGSTQPIEENVKQQKAINLISVLGQLPVVTPETYLILAERVLEAYDVVDRERILQTLQVPQGKEGPKVSVSLKGDLNEFQVADIAKQAGASEQSTDPQFVATLKAQDELDERAKSVPQAVE